MRPAGADGEGEDANLATQGFLLTKARCCGKDILFRTALGRQRTLKNKVRGPFLLLIFVL